jgi:hypothetical protein
MAATPLTPVAAPGCYANPIDVTGVAANVGGGGNTFVCSGNDYLIINNTSTTGTITMTSVADAQGRTGDITAFSVPGSKVYLWGPIKQLGWATAATGVVTVTASAATIQLTVVRGG